VFKACLLASVMTVLLCACATRLVTQTQDAHSVDVPQTNAIGYRVLGRVGGYTDSAMSRLIEAGIRQAGVSCLSLSGGSSSAKCYMSWSLNPFAPPHPAVGYTVILYVDGRLRGHIFNHSANPDTQPEFATVWQITQIVMGLSRQASAAPTERPL
jgi:hypothetical protein